jgi:7-cyano-7-deazaguanine reductase
MPAARPSKTLETFPNPKPERDFLIHMQIPEFTCLCSEDGAAGLRDALSRLHRRPQVRELKSLKLYIWSFRDQGKFHEAVTNEILDHLVAATNPRFMRLTARFYVRGGIFTTVVAEHRKKDWKGTVLVEPPRFAEESNTR